MADLMRAIDLPLSSTMVVSSGGTKTSGVVRIIKDIERRWMIWMCSLEDILDSGMTATTLGDHRPKGS